MDIATTIILLFVLVPLLILCVLIVSKTFKLESKERQIKIKVLEKILERLENKDKK